MNIADMAVIPEMQCDENCGLCCGAVFCTQSEYEAIKEYIATNNIIPVKNGITCPFYQNGKCSIYDVRPLVCRLYGHVDMMICPKGYNVNISAEIENKLLFKYRLQQKEEPILLHAFIYTESEIMEIIVGEFKKCQEIHKEPEDADQD